MTNENTAIASKRKGHPGKRLAKLHDIIGTIHAEPKHEIVVPNGWTETELKRHCGLVELKLAAEKEAEMQRERLAKRNEGFTQFYDNNLKNIRTLVDINPLALKIFLFLVEKMDRHNAVAMSQKVLEEYFEKGRTTIWRAVTVLVESGFIQVHKMANATVYAVNHQVVWKSYQNMKQYAEFSGTIILAKSEQEKMEAKEKGLAVKMTRLIDHKKAGRKGKDQGPEKAE